MKSAELETPQGPITVQRGVYYAAWERIAYMFLPLFDVPIVERLFINGERARMYFSAMHRYPGLFSSVEAPHNDSMESEWYQALGIEVGLCLHKSGLKIINIGVPNRDYGLLSILI
jgi:hypothetical protein